MLKVNCSCPKDKREAISLSYGHCFAEFLSELSLVPLGAFTPAHLCRFSVRFPLSLDISKFRNIELEVFLGRLLARVAWVTPDFPCSQNAAIKSSFPDFPRKPFLGIRMPNH